MSEPNTYTDERRAVEVYFAAEWGTLSPARFENMPWEDPKDDTPWIAFFVQPGLGRQISLNTRPLHRYSGTVIAQVFQKERTGTAHIDRLSGRFAEIFRNQTLCLDDSGLLRFYTPNLQMIGANNGWYQGNVSCQYIRDIHHSRPTT